MSYLLQQITKGVQDEWPKALLGLIVPASQYCWKFWNDHRGETRKKVLRERIASLAQLRQAPFDDNPEAARVKQDVENDYAAAVKELAELGYPKPQLAPPSQGQQRVRGWLLLYAPKRAIAWIPHTLFFISLTITVLGTIGMFASLDEGELSSGLLGLALMAAVTLLFRAWAVRSNRNGVTKSRPSRHAHRWMPTLLVGTALFLEVFFVIGSSLDDSENLSYSAFQMNLGEILGGSAFFLSVALVGWIWRRRITRRAESQAIDTHGRTS
jgi:hypothetical protein